MGEKIFLKAADARSLANTSHHLENNVYKCILEAAKENISQIDWDIKNCSQLAVIRLKEKLVEDGYRVDYFKQQNEFGEEEIIDEDILVIKW